MTNKRPSLGLPNLKSISVPPRSAIDTGTYHQIEFKRNKSLQVKYLLRTKMLLNEPYCSLNIHLFPFLRH